MEKVVVLLSETKKPPGISVSEEGVFIMKKKLLVGTLGLLVAFGMASANPVTANAYLEQTGVDENGNPILVENGIDLTSQDQINALNEAMAAEGLAHQAPAPEVARPLTEEEMQAVIAESDRRCLEEIANREAAKAAALEASAQQQQQNVAAAPSESPSNNNVSKDNVPKTETKKTKSVTNDTKDKKSEKQKKETVEKKDAIEEKSIEQPEMTNVVSDEKSTVNETKNKVDSKKTAEITKDIEDNGGTEVTIVTKIGKYISGFFKDIATGFWRFFVRE